jgi:hypothetical protein
MHCLFRPQRAQHGTSAATGRASGVEQNTEHLSQPWRYRPRMRCHHSKPAPERLNTTSFRSVIRLDGFDENSSTV